MNGPTATDFQQRTRGWMSYPGRYSLLWLFYKTPLLLYRLGFGIILRRLFRMLVLTTRGRKTGKPRRTVLEHAWLNDHAYIDAGWGDRTVWYRNIVCEPRVTVQCGGRTYGAVAVRVRDDAELRALYRATAGKSRVWKQYLDSWDVPDTVDDYVAHKERLVILRLEPIAVVPLPPLRADLAWLWVVIAVAAAWFWMSV